MTIEEAREYRDKMYNKMVGRIKYLKNKKVNIKSINLVSEDYDKLDECMDVLGYKKLKKFSDIEVACDYVFYKVKRINK